MHRRSRRPCRTTPPAARPGRTTRVVLVAGDHAWTAVLAPERVEVVAGRGDADVVVDAGASDLDLWLWRRVPSTAARVTGDPAVAAGFRARVARATG